MNEKIRVLTNTAWSTRTVKPSLHNQVLNYVRIELARVKGGQIFIQKDFFDQLILLVYTAAK